MMNFKPSRERSLYLLLATPVIALLGVFVLGVKIERDAAASVKASLARLTSEGEPIGNHTLAQWMDNNTSQETTTQWRDILVATNGLSVRFSDLLPLDDEHELAPSQPQDDADILQRYAQQAQPIIEAIGQIQAQPEPAWQPVVFNGFGTLLPDLQGSRSIIYLLSFEFRVAIDQRDPSRAIHALELILKVADAYDWQIGFVSDFVYFAAVNRHRDQIRESLAIDFWDDEEQLLQLRGQVNRPHDLRDRLAKAVATERAYQLAEFGITNAGPNYFERESGFEIFPLGVTATTGQSMLARYEQWKDIDTTTAFDKWPASDISNHENDDFGTFSILGIPIANTAAFLEPFYTNEGYIASTLYRFELNRRWTLTAVAIKLFKLQHDRFPNELSELSEIGLTKSDWMVNSKESFGYEVGGRDEVAYLWSIDFETAKRVNGEPVVAAERPVTSDDPNKKIDKWVTEVR
ncbi:hypothetical protein SH528x_004767 [Novipirellula sp. SH528]|uniref:hypothetical protein n=1 Tax=Novipirellula sp. SH528 TaxID=3454466 RepID=UPI003FA14A9B